MNIVRPPTRIWPLGEQSQKDRPGNGCFDGFTRVIAPKTDDASDPSQEPKHNNEHSTQQGVSLCVRRANRPGLRFR